MNEKVSEQGSTSTGCTSGFVDVPEAKRAELMRKKLGPPMAPAEIPSFLWFHPITVSSYDETTGDLTLFIKRMGAKDDEWSGQIIKTVQAVKSGVLEQKDVRVYVGGPHGNLQVQPDDVDHVVLCAGGIGVTPMAAILEDQIRNAGATQNQTTLIWTTRAPSEIKAFAYLFDAIAALPAEQKNRFDVRVFVTSGKENTADVEAAASKIVKVRSGRPDFDALVSECAEKPSPRRRVRMRPRGDVRRRRERRRRQQVPRAPRNLRVLTRRSHSDCRHSRDDASRRLLSTSASSIRVATFMTDEKGSHKKT